jgi:hypothetical protein
MGRMTRNLRPERIAISCMAIDRQQAGRLSGPIFYGAISPLFFLLPDSPFRHVVDKMATSGSASTESAAI